MLFHDQHVHTHYSVDSQESLEKYIQKAIEYGCSYFVNTDHTDINLTHYGSDWLVDFNALKKEQEVLQKKYPQIKLLLGVEIGYKKQYLDRITSIMNSEDFDLINLSVHDYNGIDFYFKEYYFKHGVDNLINLYFDLCVDALNTMDNFDVFSHFDYGFKCAWTVDNNLKIQDYENKIIPIFKKIIEKGKTLEINTKVQETLNNPNHIRYVLNLYKSLGGTDITLSSDAHTIDRFRSSFDKVLPIIKECGFNQICYFVKRKKYKVDILDAYK